MIADNAIEKIRGDLDAWLSPHLAAKQVEYLEAAKLAAEVTVHDEASLQVANVCLAHVVGEKDGLEAVRKAGPGALDSIVRTLNAKFKPLRDLLEAAESNLKNAIGRHVVAQRQLQQQAHQAAATAHAQGAHDEARSALAVASSAQTQAPAGTGVREVWTATIIAPDMLMREWLIPDEAKIAKHARETPIDREPFPISGVKFTREPIVTKRRH